MKFVIAALLFFATAVQAAQAPGTLSDPALEARARALQKELRCVVCQGESIDESNAPIAADIRRLIRERIQAGESNEQIKQYLVGRYGDFVLMKPPLEPNTWFLWFGPAAVLVTGGAIAAMVVVRANRRAKGT
ncbi:MAG TPA: cytochrome c-type biogenesis protein [Rhizomicrobium sp.]|nr:cytochrome c-type biogenesis protein [Rhizomicrobium sp.]